MADNQNINQTTPTPVPTPIPAQTKEHKGIRARIQSGIAKVRAFVTTHSGLFAIGGTIGGIGLGAAGMYAYMKNKDEVTPGELPPVDTMTTTCDNDTNNE